VITLALMRESRVIAWQATLYGTTAVVALIVVVALLVRAYRLARLAAAAQVVLILVGWLAASIPTRATTLTVAGTAAPAITLRLTLIVLGAGTLLLVPSLVISSGSSRVVPPFLDHREVATQMVQVTLEVARFLVLLRIFGRRAPDIE